MFDENPCRWNALEVFQVNRSTTDRKTIMERENEAQKLWKLQELQIVLRNGEKHPLDEARLNRLRERLDKPLLRLQEEQLVHDFHSFAGDLELLEAVRNLTAETAHVQTPAVAGEVLVSAIGEMLPVIEPPKMEDDLPWPEPPAPLPVEREALSVTILRDC